jgi:hypothetical protein
MWHLTEHNYGDMRQVIAMRDGHEATGKRQPWRGVIGMLAALLLVSAWPGYAWHGRHRFGGPHVFIGPPIVAPFGPYWAPYWAPYGYPPVIVEPPPQVYVQPSPPVAIQPPPPSSWYYCEDPPGYYPYVPQCPGGWRQVPATPP